MEKKIFVKDLDYGGKDKEYSPQQLLNKYIADCEGYYSNGKISENLDALQSFTGTLFDILIQKEIIKQEDLVKIVSGIFGKDKIEIR
jgi:hypothetical protein